MRAIVVVVVLIVYLACCFGLRSWLHRRATGSSGFHGFAGGPRSLGWWAGVAFVVGLALAIAAPILVLFDVEPLRWRPAPATDAIGGALVALGAAGTWWSQSAMGRSWRVGVRASERTDLVVTGPFRWVRNPIFSSMIAATVGLAVLLPVATALAALACTILAIELQVRVVEEPYLRGAHGERYAAYCRTVGRFVPRWR